MKKAILIILFIASSNVLKCDFYFLPYPITSYSAKFIISSEIFEYSELKNTTNYWGSLGIVGSVFDNYAPPFIGLEAAVERRHYFKSDQFKHFSVSAFIGGGCMTNFKASGIGLVPGLKINYKANLKANLVLEPYISLSVPITLWLIKDPESYSFPALTFGLRFGINKLSEKRYKT